MLKEADVGITEFANSALKVSGILRCRYADFKVEEIDHEMNIAELTSTDAPEESVAPKQVATFDDEAAIKACAAAFAKDVMPDEAGNLLKFLQRLQQREVKRKADRQKQPDRQADAVTENQLEKTISEPLCKPANDDGDESALELRFKDLKDKQVRTSVHMFFKEGRSLPRLVTDAVKNSDGSVDIRVLAQSDLRDAFKGPRQDHQTEHGRGRGRGGKGGRGARGGRGVKRLRASEGGLPDVRGLQSEQQAAGTPYTRMVLKKVNRDSQHAVNMVASSAGVPSRAFGIAGTKDKRGVTSQFITAWNVPAAKLARANNRLNGVAVGDFTPSATPLRLGDLAGNRFTIVLRSLEGSAEHATAAVAALRASGFINYFGLQRFGTGSVATHTIGVELMAGRWESAVKAVLGSHGSESPAIEVARKLFWESNDAAAAAKAMPGRMHAEVACLEALAKHGEGAWLKGAQAIPHGIRTMYMHAVQSFLWNTAASARLHEHGHRAVAGDLVMSGEVWPDGGSAETPLHSQVCGSKVAPGGQADEEGAPDQGGHSGNISSTGGNGVPKKKQKRALGSAPDRTARARMDRVTVVTADDVEHERYSIDDVVLPLPGSDIQYPEWPTGTSNGACDGGLRLYERIAKSLGVDLCTTGAEQHSVREFSMAALRGDYRRLIVRPRFLRHVFVKHSSVHDDIVSEGFMAPQSSKRRNCETKKSTASGGGRGDATGDYADPAADGKAAEACDPSACEGAAHTAADEQKEASASLLAAIDKRHTPASLLENAYSAEDGLTFVMQDQCSLKECGDGGREGGDLLSLVMTFALPSSCYATMLLRELLKGSTATDVHKQAYAEAEGNDKSLASAAVEEEGDAIAEAAASQWELECTKSAL